MATRLKIKNLLIAASVVSVVFFAVPEPVRALAFLGPMAVTIVAYVILYLLQYLGSMLFSLAGYLVSIALNFNFQILNSSNIVVSVGWEITRDIANLGFVLVIIFIALATIVRYQDYGAKKLLPKLIAAAVIVNFSLTIAGTFIGFSHVVTRYFLSAVVESGASSGTRVGVPLSDSGLLSTEFTRTLSGAFTKFGTRALLGVTSLFFIVIFIFIASFVLLAFALMLVIRYVTLSFLLILAPLTWLFWVIPSLSKQFGRWWDKFISWTFFAPAVSFFFYLALVSIKQVSSGAAAVSTSQFFKDGFMAAIMQQGVRMVILIGLLIGGLIAAQEMSITGAEAAKKMVNDRYNKTRKWAWDKTKSGAARAATAPLRSDKGQEAIKRLKAAGAKGFNFNNVPFIKGTKFAQALNKFSPGATQSITRGLGINALGGALGRAVEKQTAEYQKRKSELSKESVNKQSEGYANDDDVGKAARVANISEAGISIAKELLAADLEIKRATNALNSANTPAEIASARERLGKASGGKRELLGKRNRFENAISTLPPGVRAGLTGGVPMSRRGVVTTYIEQKRAGVPATVFNIANLSTKENGLVTYRNKKARRYIATVKDTKTGKRRIEYWAKDDAK
ncbi:MAG: hypothetical protein UX22_C0006G0013 [Candidatus Jorgensenbacteria bacterium GW2011_GWA2_45_9]|uniref:Uncharacterized protein n=1 Tax=Candidatus Jorgensenbacteria bacterium GW2011_GWA2_45_9 TaxID=1618663 RepID=A0A0G1R420_9BACT|nr:MAG: hypothetical protein UX22_C0006G0013 [Candidatus Jorgensenbacteria bacterium GW2011_GWA2_45_9]